MEELLIVDKLAPSRLRVSRFEGLREQHLMYRAGNKFLFWTMQHYADVSYGNYEVRINGKSRFFKKLGEAIDCFNGG